MNDTTIEQQHRPGDGGSLPLLRNSPTRKIESNTSTNNTPTSTTSHHPYLTHRTSTNTSQSSLSSHGSSGGGKIRSRSSSNSKLSNAAGHGGGLTNKRKKTSKNQLLAHCLTVPELSTSARQQQQYGSVRRGSRNRLRDELSRDNASSSVGQSSRRRSNRLLAAKSTPLISGRGDSFGDPSSRHRIPDYDSTNIDNQQNEEWGVIQEQQQQQPLVSLSNAMLSSSAQKQHKENPLLTKLLDAKGCSTGVSVGGSSSILVADRPQTEVAKPLFKESNNNNFGTLAKAKVRAEKKAEEKVIKCIDTIDKATGGVDNKVRSPQDDKMLIDEEVEETSKENHKPREDTTSSSPPPSTASTSRTISTTSKWSQSIVNSCPWWITSFLPSASTESQAFLMSPSSAVAAVDDEEPSSSTPTSSSRPRSNSNIPHKKLRFSTQQDIIPSSYEVTSTDLKNSWLLATNIPTTLSNIQMISAHRGITVSYSLQAVNIVGKTSMVHIEPTQLINRINLSKDRYRLAVLDEQKRQREEEATAAAEGEKEEEMDDYASDEGNDHESSGCNMDNVEKLGKVASIYSEWGVELALSRWWMER